ncbi:MAG: hypothetical protein WC785_06620 [Tatlockia sp.]|jgi:hypothetical protein
MIIKWYSRQFAKAKSFFKAYPQYIPLCAMLLLFALPINLYLIVHGLSKVPIPVLKKHKFITQRPSFSVDKFLNGTLQKEYEYWFNENNPLRSTLVKFNNQFYYSLFTKSLMYDSNLIIGKKNFIYEKVYIDQYVNLNKTDYSVQQFEKWAQDLKAISDHFAKQGKLFIYLITPSKVAFYPEYLPSSYQKRINNPRPDYYLKIEALKKSGVAYFDASNYIVNAKAKAYGELLFTQGGTHWTMLSAALTTRKMLKIISKLTNVELSPLKFTYSEAFKPQFVDKDLLELCKLLFPNLKYRVPQITFEESENNSPLKLAIIGGSFTHFFRTLFAETKHFSQVDHFYYLILNHYQVSKDGSVKEVPIHQEDSHSYKTIFAADVVILEENELLPYSNHMKELYFQVFGTRPA